MLKFSSARWYGETVATTNNQIFVQYQITTSSGMNNSVTPEKANSRSPASSGSYGSNSTNLSANGYLVYWAQPDFSHNAWISGPRYPIISGDAEGSSTQISGATPSLTAAFTEDNGVSPRSIRKRTTKPGYFPRLGNELHQHQKTGGGAFSMLAPHFDNDITFTDSSAWRQGMSQSDFWNINLFAVIPRRRVNVT
jgi:hypothetical protein